MSLINRISYIKMNIQRLKRLANINQAAKK